MANPYKARYERAELAMIAGIAVCLRAIEDVRKIELHVNWRGATEKRRLMHPADAMP
jgi:hypothetical protein